MPDLKDLTRQLLLEQQVKSLVSTLRFYAKAENYADPTRSPIAFDEGDRARASLRAIGALD